MISFCSLSIKNSICVKELSLGAPADVTDKCPGCSLPPRGGHKEAAILSRLMSYGDRPCPEHWPFVPYIFCLFVYCSSIYEWDSKRLLSIQTRVRICMVQDGASRKQQIQNHKWILALSLGPTSHPLWDPPDEVRLLCQVWVYCLVRSCEHLMPSEGRISWGLLDPSFSRFSSGSCIRIC